jgi:tagatose 6-phosphate kinase
MAGRGASYKGAKMILTVTMNPSIDTAYHLDGPLAIDDVNRVAPLKTAGGKGLNVTRVLGQLGDDVVATGLLGGKMGEFLADRMDEDGVVHDFARIAGESRVCIAVLHEGNQTEFLESGPEVSADELEGFVEKFRELATKADVVTMSGSLPRGVDAGCYARLTKIASEAGAKVLLDTSGASLDAALSADAKPYLMKPNLSELGGLLGREFDPDDLDAIRDAIAEDGRFTGVAWVVVSMGAAGSAAFVGDDAYRAKAPRIECVNATGSGDSTIAGFAHGIASGAEPAEVLRLGNTCGTLNAMDPKTGHLPMDKWNEVYDGVEVTKF